VIAGGSAGRVVSGWRDRLDELDSEHRYMLEGGSLSQMFLRYPLTVSHPVFVGGFYGLLIGLTLLLPYGYIGSIEGQAAEATQGLGSADTDPHHPYSLPRRLLINAGLGSKTSSDSS